MQPIGWSFPHQTVFTQQFMCPCLRKKLETIPQSCQYLLHLMNHSWRDKDNLKLSRQFEGMDVHKKSQSNGMEWMRQNPHGSKETSFVKIFQTSTFLGTMIKLRGEGCYKAHMQERLRLDLEVGLFVDKIEGFIPCFLGQIRLSIFLQNCSGFLACIFLELCLQKD